jgi:hypothetical protein
MFTKRVVADSDPAEPTTPKPFAAGAAGAIGTGRAYVWKGAYLAELQYNDEQATPEALAQASARVLPLIGKGIGDALPGPGDLPPAVVVLPVEHRVTNGVQLLPKDALGIEGLGPVGVGYYQDGKARWRDIALVADEAKAKAAWKLVKSRPGALPVLGVGDEAVVVTLTGATPEAPRREYVVARKGSLVAGVGDEELAGKEAALSKDAKTARLRAWLAAAKK